jgi:hypothetical protein
MAIVILNVSDEDYENQWKHGLKKPVTDNFVINRMRNALEEATVLPDNATLGDVFNAVIDVDRDCKEVEGRNGEMTFTFTQETWNSPFVPKENKEEDIERE